MINIDQLRYYYEKPFLDLIEGIEKNVFIMKIHIEHYIIRIMNGIFYGIKYQSLLVYDDIKVYSFLKETFYVIEMN